MVSASCPASSVVAISANAPKARPASRASAHAGHLHRAPGAGQHRPAAPQLPVAHRTPRPHRPACAGAAGRAMSDAAGGSTGEHHLDVPHHQLRRWKHRAVDALQQPAGRAAAIGDEERRIDVPAPRGNHACVGQCEPASGHPFRDAASRSWPERGRVVAARRERARCARTSGRILGEGHPAPRDAAGSTCTFWPSAMATAIASGR